MVVCFSSVLLWTLGLSEGWPLKLWVVNPQIWRFGGNSENKRLLNTQLTVQNKTGKQSEVLLEALRQVGSCGPHCSLSSEHAIWALGVCMLTPQPNSRETLLFRSKIAVYMEHHVFNVHNQSSTLIETALFLVESKAQGSLFSNHSSTGMYLSLYFLKFLSELLIWVS